MEQYAIAYPRLDKNIISMVLDFEDQLAKKYGEDYDFREHLEEIFPDIKSEEDTDSSVTLVTQDVEEGGQSTSSDNSATECNSSDGAEPQV